jgi:MoxR-like ATPase
MNREVTTLMERVLYEVKKVVVGQDPFLERVLVAMLAQGHLLVEGVPGLAKTLTVKTLARTVQGSFRRIQFTPDLVPADLVGTRIYSQKTGDFSTSLGPVFCNLLLADEINRAPAKVQSALLEAMQERQVTIGGHSHALPRPFLVMATQNPIEQEGTYPLPEAQTDRFLFKLMVDYPSEAAEHGMLKRWGGITRHPDLHAVSSAEELLALRAAVDAVYVSEDLQRYVMALVRNTRALAAGHGAAVNGAPRTLAYGASPRATLALVQAARALAFVRGQEYATPGLVQELFADAVRHRVGLTYEAEAEQISADQILRKVVETTPVPERA